MTARELPANNNLAFALLKAGRYDEADSLFRRSMKIQDAVYRPEHPNRSHPLMGLASVRMADRRFAAAEPLLRRAVELRRGGLPAGHRETGEALSDLGACLTALRRFAAAESSLVEAHQILKAGVGTDDRRTQHSLRRLVDLYDQWEKPDQAARFRLALPVAPPPPPR